ncbi:MAG TPA: ATP synthase F1 subunit epsilon [Candidatus Dormibacteraeota bacterium]|nr:ATP synthase F1 subunit epsilon [Candidatus Dormibacteraeota bacterium]
MAVPTRLLAAQQPLFEGDCDFIVARGASGELGVLPGHAPLLTWLKPGELMLRQGHDEHFFFLEGSYLEVLPNRVLILASGGVLASELDPAAADEARRVAQDALSRTANPEPNELARLQRELEVADYRLQAAERDRRRRRD